MTRRHSEEYVEGIFELIRPLVYFLFTLALLQLIIVVPSLFKINRSP